MSNQIKVKKCDKGKLLIINCDPWGMKCLIDTGSDSSIITSDGLKLVRTDSVVMKCDCLINTLTGSQRLLGKVKLNLKGLIGVNVEREFHVLETCGPKYDAIIGMDILREVNFRVKFINKGWQVKLRDRIYKTKEVLETSNGCNITNVSVSKTNRITEDIAGLVRSYGDCVYTEGEPLSTTGRIKHRIELTTTEPVFVRPRRYPHKVKEIIRTNVNDMLSQGIIRKSKSPYCSPLWVVPKKSGCPGKEEYRVVVDYRELNLRTKVEKYPLPRLEDMLDRMEGATVFSVVDLKSGYHQIAMADEDICKTAFSFERGHYEFLRMPFGLRNAPSTFQRLMDEFLEELDENSTQIYMDDIIIFSKGHSEHKRHLKELLDRVRRFGLKISPEKSKFAQTEVKFMGHLVSAEGVKPNFDRVRAIREIPVPKTVKEVRTFLGMLGYYRRFIDRFADLTEPLTNLLKKGTKFEVSDRVTKSVEDCKRVLSTAPILKFPNFGRPFVVTTDASQEALGAVLSQIDEEGDRPIAFASRKLTPAERRYSTIERELLGVVWATEYFRPYLFGTQFQIKTDHMPLLWAEKLKETSSRIARWKERLAAYSFTIHHTKGVDNVVADCLSRNIGVTEINEGNSEPFALQYLREWAEDGPDLPETTPTNVDVNRDGGPGTDRRLMTIHRGIINDKANQIVWDIIEGNGQINSEFRRYGHTKLIYVTSPRQTHDRDIALTMNQILQSGKLYYFYAKDSEAREIIRNLFERREIGQRCEIIECEKRLETVRDEDRQTDIIRNHHEGLTNHRGINETIEQLRRTYYWIKLRQTVRDFILQCEICNRAKYDRHPPRAPQLITPSIDGPFKKVFIDIFHYEKGKYLTVIDVFSRAIQIVRLANKKGESVRKAILDYLAAFGIPLEISMDKGREFYNRTVKTLFEEFNIKPHWGTTGHHRSQGIVERAHNTITEHLHLLKLSKNLEADEALPRAIIAYNNSIHSSTRYTPLELALAIDGDTLNRRRETTKRILKEKQLRINRWNKKNAEELGRMARVGSTVYKKNFYKRRKGDIRFVGPYVIRRRLRHNRVLIERCNAPRGRKEILHIDDLKFINKSGRRKLHVCNRESEED